MPVLPEEHVRELIDVATLYGKCRDCGHRAAQDYCRTCDEFYRLHALGCPKRCAKDHSGHRLTIIPFVEER